MSAKKIFSSDKRPLVCVQGLGFVGLAVATVIANAKDSSGSPLYNVVGLDIPNRASFYDQLNQGQMPFHCEDQSFPQELKQAYEQKNFLATSETNYLSQADFVICDVNLDINLEEGLKDQNYKKAVEDIGNHIKEDCLVLIESTVPPGYCQKIIAPKLAELFLRRGLKSTPLLCHSYERVMPGADYLNSIRNLPRALSSDNPIALNRGHEFLQSFVNTKEFPLKIETQTSATELAKILENSFRAMNIAFIYEWTLLAEKMGVNLFSVVDGIKKRPTHKNIMAPGLGVGGYCLTKDALLAQWSCENLYQNEYGLPFSLEALKINKSMPLHTYQLIQNKRSLKNTSVLLMGISYREDVGDTRFAPSQTLAQALLQDEAKLSYWDSFVPEWRELPEVKALENLPTNAPLPHDIVVLVSRHQENLKREASHWCSLIKKGALVVDTFNILDDNKITALLDHGVEVIGVGKGHIPTLHKKLLESK